MFLYLNSLRNGLHSLKQLPPDRDSFSHHPSLWLSLSHRPALDRALTNSRPSRWPHSKYPTSLAGNRNVFVCAEILSVPLTRTQTRNIQQTLIYDNLVHLIIATEHCSWPGRQPASRRPGSPCRNPSTELRQWAGHFVLFCSVRPCSLRLCVKHFRFHFPFKFNANLLAGQAVLHFGERSKFCWGIIYHGTQAPESFRSVFELDEAHNQHIRFIISLCDTFK